MKKMSKGIVYLMCVLFWTQISPVMALENPGTMEVKEIYVNYQLLESVEQAYINQQHQVMTPLNSVMEALGKTVGYDPASGQVTIQGDRNIPEVVFYPDGTTTLDGTLYQGEGFTTILNQRTYLPLQWLVDFYGYQVYCEEVTRSVYINTGYTMKPEDFKGFRRMENLPKPTFVSHAGGTVKEITHTNSKQAIEDSLKRGNYFVELDFLFTTDQQVVLGHNWGLMSHLMELTDFPVSHETFMKSSLADGLTQMDLADLAALMEKEERLFVITDAKAGNLQLLSLIAQEYPTLKHRFIPQVYDEKEYETAVGLGYKHIIYSLYQAYRTDSQVLDFVTRYNPYAVTMATERVKNGLAKKLKMAGVYTYTHTINTEEELVLYQKMGVDGVYSATLPVILSEEVTGTSFVEHQRVEE